MHHGLQGGGVSVSQAPVNLYFSFGLFLSEGGAHGECAPP